MIVAAFDLSLTGTGYAVATNGQLTEHGLIPGVGTDMERLKNIRDRVCDKIEDCFAALVVFEDFSYASKDGKAFERAGLAYMIRAELHTDKRPYCLVSPQSLKKFVVGTAGSPKMKVTKDLILLNMFKRFGHELNDNNVADACGLAYIGMALVGDWEPTLDAQRAVLAVLRKSNPQIAIGLIPNSEPAPTPAESASVPVDAGEAW